MTLADVPGIVTAAELQQTVDAIAEWQLPVGHDPVVPRRPRRPVEPRRGGHGPHARRPPRRGRAGLRLAGRHPAPRRRLAPVLPGRPGRAGQARRQRLRLRRRRRVAPLAAAPATAASPRRCGRWSSGPSTSCSTCRRRGARSSGPATPTARRGRSPCSPGRRRSATACAAPSPWPSGSATSAPTGSCRPPAWRHVIRHEPDAFAPKHRWAMDWYYPVLTGVVAGDAGRERLADRHDAFVMDGRGVRCVADRPWITAAETCECALAHLAVGDTEVAADLFRWAQRYRTDDGRYWTGTVFPDEGRFPAGERSTYTAAAVVLAADALAGGVAGQRPVRRATTTCCPRLIETVGRRLVGPRPRRPLEAGHGPRRSTAERAGGPHARSNRPLRAPAGRSARTAGGRRRRGRGTRRGWRACRRARRAASTPRSRGGPARRRGRRR